MKKIISTCLLVTALFNLHAQPVLYGLTSGNNGTISKLDVGANSLSDEHLFNYIGTFPTGHLLPASDGKLYGMTSFGGSNGVGVIFSFDPSNSQLTRLKNFDGTDGSKPQGSLIQASDGKLYGMTLEGGTNNYGVLFSFDPFGSVYTKLIDFDNNNRYPQGSLIQASDGKLYGMTSNGGSADVGTMFSFNPSGSVYTNLLEFSNVSGANPYGSLIQASDGKLYGMTTNGGTDNFGVIFCFDPSGEIYTKLNDFDNTNGGNPYGSLLQTSDGKMYGTTNQGGADGFGVIFSFDISGSIYTKLADFDNANGANPYCSLIQGSNGKLYGLTHKGGADDYGVIFSFNPVGSVYTKLQDLEFVGGKNGFRNELTQFQDGKLYGMSYQGGVGDYGILFSFDLSGSVFMNVSDFYGIGGSPYGDLIQGSDGKLYGMTSVGGANNSGTIFSFEHSNSVYKKVHDFDNINGMHPLGSLIQASDGKLYGMTQQGGTGGYGVIFSFDPSTSLYEKLMDFDNTNGAYPYGSLKQASNGKLYGMTQEGGTDDIGVIFSFDPLTSACMKLKDLDNSDGTYPQGSLMQSRDGKLYGMTSSGGGSDYGVIFSIDPSTSLYTKLYDFDLTTNGGIPYGSLIQASDNKLYGMASRGGSNNAGVIFSFDPSISAYTKLNDFDGVNGASPYGGSLLQASDGKLYGMTTYGGTNGYGVIFSLDLPGSVFTKVKDFDGVYGGYPLLSSLIELCTNTTSLTKQPLATQMLCRNVTAASLTVTTNGTGLSYKWYADNNNSGFNGTAVSGATNSSFTPPTTTAGTFYYYVVVKGACGTVTSAYAKVIVNASPVIKALTCSNGSITPSGSTTVNCGGSQKYTITPAACYRITSVLIDGVSNATAASGTYTFTSVQANHTISATFTANAVVNAGTINCTPTVCFGSTTTFTSNGTSGGSWSSSNILIAKVNASTGIVTGVKAGIATIKYTVTNSCGSKYTTKDITVVTTPNAGTLSCSPTVCVGSTTPVTSNGNSGGSWSSSNILIAKVNASTGMVTGVKAGTATITYTVTNNCSSKSVTKSITVAAGTPVITAHPGSPFTRNAGSSCSYIVSGTEFNATATCSCGVPTLSYTLSGATSGTGTSLTGVKLNKGATTITWKAVMGSLTSSCSVTVNVSDKQLPTISCKPGATKTATGSTYTISGKEFDAATSDNCGTPSLMYCLSGKTVSAYSASNTTLAGKKLNVGATTITWKTTDGSGNVSTCATLVTVSKPNNPVSMLPADMQVTEPEPAPFTVRVMPNPTSNYFTLQLNSKTYEKFTIAVMDVSGRMIEQRTSVVANSNLQLGNTYHPGVYIAQISQGKNKVVLRLVKEGN